MKLLLIITAVTLQATSSRGATPEEIKRQCNPNALKVPIHCYKKADDGDSYEGNVDRSVDGKRCVPWNDFAGIVKIKIGINHRFCRNFDGLISHAKSPWCYTGYFFRSWDYCAIPTCDDFCSGGNNKWLPFSKWVPCSKSCEKGVQSRMRKCPEGGNCKGNQTETRLCNDFACDTPEALEASKTYIGAPETPIVNEVVEDNSLPWYVWLFVAIGILLVVAIIVGIGIFFYVRKQVQDNKMEPYIPSESKVLKPPTGYPMESEKKRFTENSDEYEFYSDDGSSTESDNKKTVTAKT